MCFIDSIPNRSLQQVRTRSFHKFVQIEDPSAILRLLSTSFTDSRNAQHSSGLGFWRQVRNVRTADYELQRNVPLLQLRFTPIGRTKKKKSIEFFRHSFPYTDSTFSRLHDKMEGTIVGNVTTNDFRNIQISSECFFSYVLISHDHTAFVNIPTT